MDDCFEPLRIDLTSSVIEVLFNDFFVGDQVFGCVPLIRYQNDVLAVGGFGDACHH